MTVKRIHIDIALLTAGGLREAALDGYAYLEAGFLKGSIPEGSGFDETELTLLTALTFTGCPVAARCDDPSLNPWLRTDGEYEGVRTLQGECFQVQSEIVSRLQGGTICMALDARVEGKLPALLGVARPFQEIIKFTAPECLVGAFSIEFATSGGPISADARTLYRLTGISSAPDVWRNITIESSLPQGALVQVEQIDLFGSREAAAADLSSKLATYH